MAGRAEAWARELLRYSPLKAAKLAAIKALLPPITPTSRCLDIGGDNGAISLGLRDLGGRWVSADLEEVTGVMQQVLGEGVVGLKGEQLPFERESFDLVVVVDYLEHVPDDARLVAELARVLRPGGVVVVNVPHPKEGGWIERLRHRLGLTDAWHGHLRPGYSVGELERLMNRWFTLEEALCYSGAASELMDTALNFVYMCREKGSSGAKGMVVDPQGLGRKGLGMMRAVWVVGKVAQGIERAVVGGWGYRAVVRAKRQAWGGNKSEGLR